MNLQMECDEISDMIQAHEGYEGRVYLDSVGVPTGGYGHAFLVGSEIPIEVARRLFWHDMKTATDDYEKLKIDLSDNRRAVIIDMLFNLGITKFRKFKLLIAALKVDDYIAAGAEMKDSKWYWQVKGRSRTLVKMMVNDISFKEVV